MEQGCFKPLLEASQNGHPEITRALQHAGADPNAGSLIPLVEASHEGHAEIVKQLLAARADSLKRGQSDLTALEKATLRGHQEIVDLLAKAASKKLQYPPPGNQGNHGSPHSSEIYESRARAKSGFQQSSSEFSAARWPRLGRCSKLSTGLW